MDPFKATEEEMDRAIIEGMADELHHKISDYNRSYNRRSIMEDYELKVGDFVYSAYTPQSPGKVIRITEGVVRTAPSGNTYKEPPTAEIKWLKGKTTIVSVLGLRNFRTLISDHEKKLETHRRTLAKLEAL